MCSETTLVTCIKNENDYLLCLFMCINEIRYEYRNKNHDKYIQRNENISNLKLVKYMLENKFVS